MPTTSTPKFTRRDYQYLADWAKRLPRLMTATGLDFDDLSSVSLTLVIVESLADHLAATNPNFDRRRFVAAATPEGTVTT